MKAIWTFLFLALIATTVGLAVLLVPESGQTERFWLSIGAIAFSEFLVWIAFTFRGNAHGEQASGLAGAGMITSTLIYFLATIGLGFVALAPLGFKVLLALHVVALLVFAFAAGIAAIGTRALQSTREANQK